jgi:hypothetical protein
LVTSYLLDTKGAFTMQTWNSRSEARESLVRQKLEEFKALKARIQILDASYKLHVLWSDAASM